MTGNYQPIKIYKPKWAPPGEYAIEIAKSPDSLQSICVTLTPEMAHLLADRIKENVPQNGG